MSYSCLLEQLMNGKTSIKSAMDVFIWDKKYKCESVRLCRFLYSLGFDKESMFDENNKEYWLFEQTQDLQKSLDFFFIMRKKQKKKLKEYIENQG